MGTKYVFWGTIEEYPGYRMILDKNAAEQLVVPGHVTTSILRSITVLDFILCININTGGLYMYNGENMYNGWEDEKSINENYNICTNVISMWVHEEQYVDGGTFTVSRNGEDIELVNICDDTDLLLVYLQAVDSICPHLLFKSMAIDDKTGRPVIVGTYQQHKLQGKNIISVNKARNAMRSFIMAIKGTPGEIRDKNICPIVFCMRDAITLVHAVATIAVKSKPWTLEFIDNFMRIYNIDPPSTSIQQIEKIPLPIAKPHHYPGKSLFWMICIGLSNRCKAYVHQSEMVYMELIRTKWTDQRDLIRTYYTTLTHIPPAHSSIPEANKDEYNRMVTLYTQLQK